MPKTTAAQRKTIGRVMHEFKHGELESGPEGKGGEVSDPRQAVAIALHEAGASKFESEAENEENLKKTKEKEAHGQTAQQESEGKSRVGARGRRESSKAMGGKNAKRTTRRLKLSRSAKQARSRTAKAALKKRAKTAKKPAARRR